mmetsp:Transcript_26208/g.68076  ORF Transcript_26208/g.68076 Transcript_26208/m.68076 type:complete len:221 (+) Transcript_26208:1439-2101(+)
MALFLELADHLSFPGIDGLAHAELRAVSYRRIAVGEALAALGEASALLRGLCLIGEALPALARGAGTFGEAVGPLRKLGRALRITRRRRRERLLCDREDLGRGGHLRDLCGQPRRSTTRGQPPARGELGDGPLHGVVRDQTRAADAERRARGGGGQFPRVEPALNRSALVGVAVSNQSAGVLEDFEGQRAAEAVELGAHGRTAFKGGVGCRCDGVWVWPV